MRIARLPQLAIAAVTLAGPMPASIAAATLWWQPPTTESATNLFDGWAAPSRNGGATIAADDWRAPSSLPLTRVRWWGALPGWVSNTPPAGAPSRFQIAIWSDNAGPQRPLAVLYTAEVTATTTWAGWIFDARSNAVAACFLHEADLPAGRPFQPTALATYWLSLGEVSTSAAPAWGWCTRPRDTSSVPGAAYAISAPTAPLSTSA